MVREYLLGHEMVCPGRGIVNRTPPSDISLDRNNGRRLYFFLQQNNKWYHYYQWYGD